ncbi:unnamed protein product [Lepidochelys kempii]
MVSVKLTLYDSKMGSHDPASSPLMVLLSLHYGPTSSPLFFWHYASRRRANMSTPQSSGPAGVGQSPGSCRRRESLLDPYITPHAAADGPLAAVLPVLMVLLTTLRT